MQLLCPECCSEELGPHPDPTAAELRCDNCGATLDREEAHVTVAEAEARLAPANPEPLFTLHSRWAAIELRHADGALAVVNPYSDADEIHALLDNACLKGIIESRRDRAAISVYPLSRAKPTPVLAVDPGARPVLLGSELHLRERDGEDPISFTLRLLEDVVVEANALASERVADSLHLDRIAAFLNQPGQWNGGDVCEFVAKELVSSGRRLLDADE